MSSCDVFEYLVELFNISETTYLKKSSALESQIAQKYTDGKGYTLELEILNGLNETYATVFSTENNIIIGFKGTTTMENMKTDIIMKMVGISNALPSRKGSIHEIVSSLDWKNSKIHKGFAEEYSSVSDELIEKIATLHAKRKRPIYFTGHSLGAR